MSKPLPRKLTVLRKKSVTPNMLRITLGGEGMQDFPEDQESAYIKLLFTRSNSQGEDLGKQFLSENRDERPIMRTYTVRSQRQNPAEIDVDFVIHSSAGPASLWAAESQLGDQLYVGGPGGKKLVDPEADWFFIAGDMTALPAISVNLEMLPEGARGYAVLEILHESDKQLLKVPSSMEIHWVVNPNPHENFSCLSDTVKALPMLDGNPSVWVACEFTAMRELRRYFRNECQINRKDLYVSSYWKRGVSEDEHKKLKREDNESN